MCMLFLLILIFVLFTLTTSTYSLNQKERKKTRERERKKPVCVTHFPHDPMLALNDNVNMYFSIFFFFVYSLVLFVIRLFSAT